MTRRVFLDIGAHLGETLEEALSPRWGFASIVCFEPASPCWPVLEDMADTRVEIERFGLWDRDEVLTLHDPGAIGASLSAEKSLGAGTEVCEVRDGAEWFRRHVRTEDTVYVKINIEGAECDLVDRLIATAEIAKIDHLMIHFDVLKIASQRHRAAETVTALNASGIDWMDAAEIMFGRSHALKTRNWLLYCEQGRGGRWFRRVPVRLWFRCRQVAYRVRERLRR